MVSLMVVVWFNEPTAAVIVSTKVDLQLRRSRFQTFETAPAAISAAEGNDTQV